MLKKLVITAFGLFILIAMSALHLVFTKGSKLDHHTTVSLNPGEGSGSGNLLG